MTFTLTLSMIALFGLLAIGTPVGFAMAGSGVLGLYLIGGMPMLSGILQTAPLSAVTSYELITIPMVPADGGIRPGQRHRRRFVQGDRGLGRPCSRRPRHGHQRSPAPDSARSAEPAQRPPRHCRRPACPRC